MSLHAHHRRTVRIVALAGVFAFVSAAPAHATFPARNGRLAFSAEKGDDVQLFTVGRHGGHLRQITHVSGADAVNPDWSPDGRRIVFEFDTEESPRVAFVNADGSGLVVLPSAPGGTEGQPSFTPDGSRIVFTRFDGVEEATWSMRLDGTDRKRITAGPGDATDPNVSPDGASLSFVGVRNHVEFDQALYTARLDGSVPRRLTPFSSDVAIKQDWAPDGRRLVFTEKVDHVHRGDSGNMATIRPDGSGLRRLTHYRGGKVNAIAGSYSPDGRRIAFRFEDHGKFGLDTMRPDGSHPTALLRLSDFMPRYIDWGPRRGTR